MDVIWLTLNKKKAFLQYASVQDFFSYKDHFHKLRQVQTEKKSSKC